MLSGETKNTKFIVFGLTRSVIEDESLKGQKITNEQCQHCFYSQEEVFSGKSD